MVKLDYMRELFEKDLYCICDSFDNWEDAIRASVGPLIKNGSVEPEYADSIVENVNTYGPYIFLAPHICMPHSKQVHLVRKSSICFMKVNQTVKYDAEDPNLQAELFFAIAATEEGEHLDFISTLVEIFEDEETMEALLEAKTEEDYKKLLGLN